MLHLHRLLGFALMVLPSTVLVAEEPVIVDAAAALKVVQSIHASRLAVTSPDRATWSEDGAEASAVVERIGACAFEIKPIRSSGLRIDFKRISVPLQHSCGTRTCTVRLSGVEWAICVTAEGAKDACRGFVQVGPIPVEAARTLLASVARVHQSPGCEPLNRR